MAAPASAPGLPAAWRPLGERYLLVTGLLLVATAVLNPIGIAGQARATLGRIRLPTAGRRRPVAAPFTTGA